MGKRVRSAVLGVCCVVAAGSVTPATVEAAAEQETRTLSSVSCPMATSCVAVGAVNGKPLIQHWNGSTWTVVFNPAGAKAGSLADVSCAAVNRCVAVGSSSDQTLLIEHWDGRKWTIKAAPGARHKTAVGAVSCATPSSCVVVGERSITGTSGLFALRWTGTRWASMDKPSMPTYRRLLGLSCPDTDTCVAVGWRQAPLAVGHVRPHKALLHNLALVWKRGAGWSAMSTPTSSQRISFEMLHDVSCPSATRCFAAGGSAPSGHRMLSWNGAKWSVAALPPRTQASLSGISCSTTTSCVAVGSTTNSPAKTLIERWNGNAWSVTPSPNVAGAESTLAGISCSTATSCHAVGTSWAMNGTAAEPLVVQWDGTRWLPS
jgi:hypothetical protein